MTKKELLEIAKPISFNTKMVVALLEGRKTVTRRAIKPQPPSYASVIRRASNMFMPKVDIHDKDIMPGDILYVQEPWNCVCEEKASDLSTKRYFYEANTKSALEFSESVQCVSETWQPLKQMPKEAARIFLKVTNIQVEHLQDITEIECEKEGLVNFCKKCQGHMSDCDDCINDEGILADFIYLWDSIMEGSDINLYGWNANPWVWVIEFEQVMVE